MLVNPNPIAVAVSSECPNTIDEEKTDFVTATVQSASEGSKVEGFTQKDKDRLLARVLIGSGGSNDAQTAGLLMCSSRSDHPLKYMNLTAQFDSAIYPLSMPSNSRTVQDKGHDQRRMQFSRPFIKFLPPNMQFIYQHGMEVDGQTVDRADS